MNVEWDENKNQQNKQKHHISFETRKKEIQIGDQPTFDAIKEIEAAKNNEINYEDAPKLSKKELSEFVSAKKTLSAEDEELFNHFTGSLSLDSDNELQKISDALIKQNLEAYRELAK
ncbi:BrnT family toxin [uncultured Treponema sp.]|uniref:BrnT family toxin n=1 Tax=uncultured Treponema sp. TaxID=162155 RepID=UPI000E7D5DC2|nr:BrnT family toxin [uncultured Treponema sp.]HAZ95984.1 hypothetical protein [Treponema sp.]